MPHRLVPEPVTGYELNPCDGFWSVVVPEATTNLITNPSMEIGGIATVSGYAPHAGGCAIARVPTHQRRGAYCMQVTPAAAAYDGVSCSLTLVAGTRYTASVYVLGVNGIPYRLLAYDDTAGAELAKVGFTGTGQWQRVILSFTTGANTATKIFLDKNNSLSIAPFYTDAWQCEAKAYATTFCDGEQDGCAWAGVPHASTSSRTAMSRQGGRVHKFEDLGFHVMAYTGMSMPPVNNTATAFGLLDGSQFQRTTFGARTMGLVGYFAGKTIDRLQRHKRDVLAAIAPDKTYPRQPVRLIYQAIRNGRAVGEEVGMDAVYAGGLDGTTDNLYQERAAMQYILYLPLIFAIATSGVALVWQDPLPLTTRYSAGRINGQWSAMDVTAPTSASMVYTMVIGPDGCLYIGGIFIEWSGVANADYVAKYDPATNTWSALGDPTQGLASILSVNAMAFGPDGTLYVGGFFENWADVAAADYIVKWSGTTWTALGIPLQGAAAITQVLAVAVDQSNNVYVGGDFLNWADVAAADYIVKWNGAWVAVGGAANGLVRAIAVRADNGIYAGGSFTTINAVSANRIASWSGTTWTALGSGVGDSVRALAIAPSGDLYLGGSFAATYNYIAKWNGVSFEGLGSGLNHIVHSLALAPDGVLYVGGYFTIAGGITLADRVAKWNGWAWAHLDIDLPGTPVIYAIATAANGNIYLGFDTTGAATAAGIVTDANFTNTGAAETYLNFVITGPGTLQSIRNATTGDELLFNLAINAGEVVTLTLQPGKIAFTSTYQGRPLVVGSMTPQVIGFAPPDLPPGPGRGSVLSSILTGSNITSFKLIPGENRITCYIGGTTSAATAAVMYYHNRYHGVDEAVK